MNKSLIEHIKGCPCVRLYSFYQLDISIKHKLIRELRAIFPDLRLEAYIKVLKLAVDYYFSDGTPATVENKNKYYGYHEGDNYLEFYYRVNDNEIHVFH